MSGRRSVWLAAGLAWSPVGWAQDAASPVFDGHGPTLPPPGASEGLAVWAHPPRLAGAWSVAGVIEAVNDLLVQQTAAGDEVPVLDDVVGIDLAASVQVHDRLGFAVTAPIWLTSEGVDGVVGPGGGDTWVWAPIDVLRRDPVSRNGFGLGVRPGLGLPTGAGGRFLGAPGVSGSLAVDLSAGFGPILLAVDVGGTSQGTDLLPAGQPVGGVRLHTDALVGVEAGPTRIAFEARSSTPLDRAVSTAADRPVELLLTATGRFGAGAWAGLGGGRGVTRGIGAPGLRVLAGGGWVHDPSAAAETAPEAVEVVKARVTDPDGQPVAGAEIRAGSKVLGVTGADGTAEVRPPRGGAVTVSAPGLEPTEARLEGAEVAVRLAWTPRPVPIRVQDQAGRPVDAAWTIAPADAPGGPALRGTGTPSLPPGRWQIAFSAEGSGEQRRVVEVPTRGAPDPVEVVLLPAAGSAGVSLTLSDADGHPVGGARVLVDGQPVGVSGSDGGVWIAGLAPGPHAVVVRSDVFSEREIEAVAADGAPTALTATLDRVPGSVRVAVRTEDGAPVGDAVLRFDGPRRLAPTPVGPQGERLQVLGAGEWRLLVSSARYGLQERTLSVPEDSRSVIGIDVVLQPGEGGASDLRVRVVDPDGVPVDRAEVALDGEAVGRTSTGGEVVLRGLDGGPRQLAIAGEHHRPAARAIALADGYQEAVVTLDWVAGATRVIARVPDAPVGDATLRPRGPVEVPARPIGSDGVELVTLPTGDWTVVVSSPSAGLFEAGVQVAPEDRRLHVVDALMLPDEGGEADLDLAVRDPDGAPVRGARVLLDGELVAVTGDTGASVNALATGSRELRVEAPPLLERASKRVALARGANTQSVALAWAPGTAEVQVVDASGAPVTDAVLRFSGPAAIPPTPVDGAGERKLALAAGRWQVLATSPSLGFGEASVTATGRERLAPVRIVLDPVAEGRAELLVRVLDPDGRPVPGAVVTAGESSEPGGDDGTAFFELAPGPVPVSVRAPGFADQAFTVPVAGATERVAILPFVPIPLDVGVADAVGQPVDAEIRLVGPEDRPVVRTGPDGAETIALRPGRWQVIAATSTLGPTLAEVDLAREPAKVRLVLESSKVEVTDAAVKIKEQVMFDFDRATLEAGSDAVLRQVANTILSRPTIIRVEVQGHTDDKGTVVYNQELSQKRAEAVVAELVKLGVPQEKLVAVGYGMQRPLVPNDSDESRAANRRVVFEIAEGAAP